MELIKRVVVLFCFALTQWAVCAQGPRPLLDIQIRYQPQSVVVNGEPTVYYELWLKNISGDSIIIDEIRVRGAGNIGFRDGGLRNRFSVLGRKGSSEFAELWPGDSAIVYMELSGLGSGKFPHEIAGSVHSESFSVAGAGVTVDRMSPLVLGAPLGAGFWAAVYNPDWQQGHRRVVYTVDGNARIPGRFAIDFVELDSSGFFASGDADQTANWIGYGAEVLAVADGVVTGVREDFQETATVSAHPDYEAADATGNYISLEIGSSRFAFYEHLKPGSIRVRKGQHVKKGEVIALLGFTGQSTGPHLHFHVADANSALGAEGVPFVFDHFAFEGSYPDFEKFGKERWVSPPGSVKKGRRVRSGRALSDAGGRRQEFVQKERPLPNAVIRFSRN